MASTLAYPSFIYSLQTKAAKGDALDMHLLLSGIYTHLCREFGIAGYSWCVPWLLLCLLPRSLSLLHPSVLTAQYCVSLEVTWDSCRVGRYEVALLRRQGAGPTESTEVPGSSQPCPWGLPGHKLDDGCGGRGPRGQAEWGQEGEGQSSTLYI